jgi:xanthine dehydrogenase accessory factor
MRDLLADYDRLAGTGPVGRAVVTAVWGSAPRPEGSSLLATPDGRMAGSVSGGCVENAAVEEVVAAIARGTPSVASWGVSHERAWELGLSCGGTISVLVEPRVRPEVLAAARSDAGSVVATVTGDGARSGNGLVVDERGGHTVFGDFPHDLIRPALAVAGDALAKLTSRLETIGQGNASTAIFFEVYPRRPTLLIFGGVHVATHLVHMAKPLGYRTVVADGREGFLTRERFPGADELILGWPEEVFARAGIDSATCICLLTHDPKFDEPALDIALRSPAVYVGAIGSRKTQQVRRERLRAAGFTEEEVARLHGPIGLDLGGRDPAEIALAILAEISAVRHKRPVPARG